MSVSHLIQEEYNEIRHFILWPDPINKMPVLLSFQSVSAFRLTEQLAAIPEFQGLGPLFKSSDLVQLTEAETEYVVRCVKHTFARHMVFQFDCTNTLNDQLLQKVPAERGSVVS